MEQLAIDWLAEATHLRAGQRPEEPVTPRQLALTLWNDPKAVQVVPRRALRGPAALVRVRGRRRVYLRDDLTPEGERYFTGHELAHGLFADEGIRFGSEQEEELACNRLSASLIAPRAAMRGMPLDVHMFAKRFRTSESIAFRRLIEVGERDGAFIRPGHVVRTGDVPMPDEDLQRIARGKAPPRGWLVVRRMDGSRERTGVVRAA